MPKLSKRDPEARLQEIWPGLSKRQKDYVLARRVHPTKKAAAESCGLNATSVYAWPDAVEEAVELSVECSAAAAMAEIEQALVKAAMGKVLEMDALDADLASRARTEILDRGMGKATQRIEQKTEASIDVSADRLSGVLDTLVSRAARLPDEG